MKILRITFPHKRSLKRKVLRSVQKLTYPQSELPARFRPQNKCFGPFQKKVMLVGRTMSPVTVTVTRTQKIVNTIDGVWLAQSG